MTPTVSDTVAVVLRRVSGKAAALNLIVPGSVSVLTTAANPDFADAVRKAFVMMGGTPASPTTLADSDLLSLTPGRITERFYDAVTIEVHYMLLGKIALCDQQVGTNYQKLSQIAEGIRADLRLLEQRWLTPFRVGAIPMSVGQPTTPVPSVRSPVPNDPFDPCRTRSPWTRWPYP